MRKANWSLVNGVQPSFTLVRIPCPARCSTCRDKSAVAPSAPPFKRNGRSANTLPCGLYTCGSRRSHPLSTSTPSSGIDADPPPAYFTGKNLAKTSAVALDGVPPYPVSVSLASDTPDAATYGLGDVIRLVATFDKNVTVLVVDSDDSDGDSTSPPVLVLDCTRMREAVFVGEGNGSTTLFFEYEVRLLALLFCASL